MRATVTVRRPDGKIETVETQFDLINDLLFAKIAKATREAGRGEVIGRDNHGVKSNIANTQTKTMRQMYAEMHAEENKSRGLCPHCGGHCDGDCRN